MNTTPHKDDGLENFIEQVIGWAKTGKQDDVYAMDVEKVDRMKSDIMVKARAWRDIAVREARIDTAAWLNVWLVEHDQASMDSGRISIKASDVLKLQADLMGELASLQAEGDVK